MRAARLGIGMVVLGSLALAASNCAEGSSGGGGPAPGGGADAAPPATGPASFNDLPIQESLAAPDVSAPVDVVRDEAGIPHVYAMNLPDAAYAQGYMMAQDRWMQMDFYRRQAKGTVSEIVGPFSPAALASDITLRTFHMQATAEAGWARFQASTDPTDQLIVQVLQKFAKGVNAWQTDLKAGKYKLPSGLSALYTNDSVAAWNEVDSLVLAELQAFQLSFDADAEIQHTLFDTKEAAVFDGSQDPAKAARAGFSDDYWRFAPFDATFTVNGWTEAGLGAPTTPMSSQRTVNDVSGAVLAGALQSLRSMQLPPRDARGSNNWVVAPNLSASGRAMVANDTHLALSNPPIFYLNHISTEDGFDVEGVQFPGAPLVTLGQNPHLAWGSTVSNVDVTDVYGEHVVDCQTGGGKCVVFNGKQVPLTSHVERFNVGAKGAVQNTVSITYYEVPHHGPIIPRVSGSSVEPLGTAELSVRYTGFESAPLLRAIYGVDVAKNVDEARSSIVQFFGYGGQNWVFADDSGNIAWTQAERLPKRPAGTAPWKVLPGDGSAEWQGYFDPNVLPHATNPPKGYLVTANADPLGVTAGNDPMAQPTVDGFPLYIGWGYDPGTREGRITRLIQDKTKNGGKLDRDAMSSIQADAFSEWGQAMAPTFVDAANALATNASDVAPLLASAKPEVVSLLPTARDIVSKWTFDTPSATLLEAPTPQQLADSQATLVMAHFMTRFAKGTLDDEASALGVTLTQGPTEKLLAQLVRDPSQLKTKETLFGNLNAPNEPATKRWVAAKAVLSTLDYLVTTGAFGTNPNDWRWGKVHTVTPSFFLPGFDLPTTPRHGGDGTVDVGNHGVNDDDYTFSSGAAIRFVAQLDPGSPLGRNVIPGGEIFDPASPHYADLFNLWSKNQAVELAFQPSEVARRAEQETAQHNIGRRRFAP